MASNVVGLFDTHGQAEEAVRRLIGAGIDPKMVSVVTSDLGGSGYSGTVHREIVDESGDLASAGAVAGATSGLLVGGLIGLLVGATVLAVPPVGFVVAGPLAGLITGAGIGMVSGGLLGALIGLGIPEEEAHIFAEGVRRGGTIVSVSVPEVDRLRVEQILAMAGSVNISERAAIYRQSGFTAYDPHAPVFTENEVEVERSRFGLGPAIIEKEIPGAAIASTMVSENVPPRVSNDLPSAVPSQYEEQFREDHTSQLLTEPYDIYRPAYHYGYELASRPEYRDLSWDALVPSVRQIWEKTNPGTWERYSHAIHTGWARVGVRPANGATLL